MTACFRLYKFDHGNYRGLKLTDQAMKLLERVTDLENARPEKQQDPNQAAIMTDRMCKKSIMVEDMS